jgi:hypothetical protein
VSERPKPRASSDQHVAVKDFRRKLESLADGALESLRDLNRKLDAEIDKRRSSKPPRDARREDDGEVPTDVVELKEEPNDEP